MSEASDPVHIRVRGLQKSYGEYHILKGVNVDMLRGKCNMILGASGSGKSVFMRQLIRLETPDAGTIEIDGHDIVPLNERQLNKVRRNFGMVFQMSALFDSMTVFDNVAFPLREHTKMTKKAVHERVMDRLEVLGVAHAANKIPAELSGGMNKRVAVARALALEPDILIYDEPTTGLDPVTSRTVDDLIVETQDRTGITSIVISHDMASVFRISHQINFLDQGKIIASAAPRDFVAEATDHVRAFLKASGVDPDRLVSESP